MENACSRVSFLLKFLRPEVLWEPSQTCKIERFTKILIAKNRELFLQKVSS